MEYVKPAFVREFEKVLKKLEQKSFNTIQEVREFNRLIEVRIEPSVFVESLAGAMLHASRPTIATVEHEPNGGRTFPDLRVKFNNHFQYDFEVKSWVSSRRGWAAANVARYYDAIENNDSKYFDAWYVDFNLSLKDEYCIIDGVTVGKIWDFADGIRKTGSNPGFVALPKGVTPETFALNTGRTPEERIKILDLMKLETISRETYMSLLTPK